MRMLLMRRRNDSSLGYSRKTQFDPWIVGGRRQKSRLLDERRLLGLLGIRLARVGSRRNPSLKGLEGGGCREHPFLLFFFFFFFFCFCI